MQSQDWRTRLQQLLDERFSARSPGAAEKTDRIEAARAWHATLVDHDLAAPGWPTTAGGLGLTLEEQLDYYRMTSAAGAPPHPCPLSFILAPTLIAHGTQAQRDRFLRPLLRADEFWCQGFSEPGAGSDLASLSTRAVRDGDDYVVTGQKVWTTMADRADWMFTLVRTGAAGRSTDGISYLLIPMSSAGITVRPLRDISGAAHFAEVFLDEVRVPVDLRVGEEGQGWSIMRTSLGHERATAFLADEFKYRHTVERVYAFVTAQGLDGDPLIRQDVARLESGVRTIAANSARALAAVLRGEDPGGVASVNRLVKSLFEQDMHRLALRASGPHAALGSRSTDALDGGRWTYGYLMSRATTIGAGTAEIQRNTIAENVLGLPSHRGEGTRPPAAVVGSPLAVADADEAELREVLAKALNATVDITALLDRRRPIDQDDSRTWSTLTEFGLPGLAADEAIGGAGAPPRLLYAAIEEAGKALAATALVPTVCALDLTTAVQADDVSRRITAGARATVAIALSDEGWVTSGVALPVYDGTTVRGVIPIVHGAPVAELFLVLARRDALGEDVVLLAVDADAAGCTVTAHEPLDRTATLGSVTLDVTLEKTRGIVLSDGHPLADALRRSARRAQLAVAADSVGIAARALAMAVEWSGERQQFGRAIGSFQAVSHPCANMLIATESARSQVQAAAEIDDTDAHADTVTDLAAAAALECAVTVTEAAIQIHGGVGFTWEHPAHLLLRRAQANQAAHTRPEKLRDRAGRRLLEVYAQQRTEAALTR
ncbi:acyl-CoA dehydrogenase [Mycobacterium eburneum]|nr:acyl-CoA dehydrogenase family protein [Mycobacterium eburneum]TDH52882.1 acyl-CoA dehydrogenase [Mycobacterium eburneum]